MSRRAAVLLISILIQAGSSHADTALRIGEIHESTRKEIKHPVLGSDITKVLFAPVYLFAQNMDNSEVPDELRAKKEHLAGYVTILVSGQIIKRAYFEIPGSVFFEKSEAYFDVPAKKVLWLDLSSPGSLLEEVNQADFERLYGKHGNAIYKQVESLAALKKLLAELPQDSTIDRLEISAHGNIGTIGFPKGEAMNAKVVHDLQAQDIRAFSPNAQVRINSCFVAADTTAGEKIGKDFIRSLGRALIGREGGQILATEKMISWESNGRKILSAVGKIEGFGIAEAIYSTAQNALMTGIPRLLVPRKDVIAIRIPASGPPCGKSFESLAP